MPDARLALLASLTCVAGAFSQSAARADDTSSGESAYTACIKTQLKPETPVTPEAIKACRGSLTTKAGKKGGGGMTAQEIYGTIAQDMYQVRYCYEHELKTDKKLKGTIEIAFVVDAAGHVESAEVRHDTVKSQALAACVAKAMRTWIFPKPRRGEPVTVNYPFKLEPL